uniref:DUF968 domain-containing protein n=1 Tax=Salmonella sp. TaxID=599 RepID=UPI001CD99F26|nr:DUF968 domain-containing protein [Salmonella sp.]
MGAQAIRELVDITAEQIVNLSVDEDSGLLYMRADQKWSSVKASSLSPVCGFSSSIGCGGS